MKPWFLLLLHAASIPLVCRSNLIDYDTNLVRLPGRAESFPLVEVDKDSRSPFKIDSHQPFHIAFGRGSGWHGLETIKLDQDGKATLHHRGASGWAMTTMKLGPNALAQVLKAIDELRLFGLDKGYHAGVADGTQWVFWVRQGSNEKSVYFNNHFPNGIVQFAATLDSVLESEGLKQARWYRVIGGDDRQHARELWNSIRQ